MVRYHVQNLDIAVVAYAFDQTEVGVGGGLIDFLGRRMDAILGVIEFLEQVVNAVISSEHQYLIRFIILHGVIFQLQIRVVIDEVKNFTETVILEVYVLLFKWAHRNFVRGAIGFFVRGEGKRRACHGQDPGGDDKRFPYRDSSEIRTAPPTPLSRGARRAASGLGTDA